MLGEKGVGQHFDIEGHVILVNGLIHTYIHRESKKG